MGVRVADQMGDVLDVDDLLVRCLGNVEFVQRVLSKFRERCDEDLAALEKAIAEGDSDGVARLAHRLKGASANAAAPRLREHAAEIEQAAREQSLGAIHGRLENLKHEWGRFTVAVSRLGTLSESPASVEPAAR